MFSSLPFLFLLGLTAQTPVPVNPAAMIAPLVAEDVIAVVYLDLQQIGYAETTKKLAGPLAKDKQFTEAVDSANSSLELLRKAGAADPRWPRLHGMGQT